MSQHEKHRANRRALRMAATRWYTRPADSSRWDALTAAYLQVEMDRVEKPEKAAKPSKKETVEQGELGGEK